MKFLNRLLRMFTRSGREDDQLTQAIELAKAKHPAKALAIYDALLATNTITDALRAKVLFNRALAYCSLKDDDKAQADLTAVLASRALDDDVRSAARLQLARIRKRGTP